MVSPLGHRSVGWRPAGIGFDLLSVFRYVASAADAKRTHDIVGRARRVSARSTTARRRSRHANRIVLCNSSPPSAEFRPAHLPYLPYLPS